MIERIAYGSLPEQFGDLRVPAGHERHPLVILIHGGFWRDQYQLDLMNPLADALTERGFASWNIEYRRVGPTGGGFPTTLDDVALAVDHHADGPWPKIAVVGHSAGGHLALWNAGRNTARRRADLTVGLAPVADVIAANRNGVGVDATHNFFGGDVDEVPERYRWGQPSTDTFAGRVVLVHGDQDDSVPVAQSQSIREHVDRLEVLPGVDHFQVIDPRHHSWLIVFEELDAVNAH